MEKPLQNLEKSTTEKPLKSKVSISAYLFVIFICFSVVYFDLSPTELFHNTKFWFFLSNALILIIAADSGAFSSSKQKYDIYEEYLENSRARNASSFVPVQTETRPLSSTETKHVIYEEPIKNNEPKIVSSVVIEQPKDIVKGDLGTEPPPQSMSKDFTKCYQSEETPYETKEIRRSKSDEAITGKEEKKKILRRSATEGKKEPRYEENEFSAMSNEELNRRVEEFIQKFNRQMRLQETRSLGWLEN